MYPTAEQIMASEVKFRTATVKAVEDWKKDFFPGWPKKPWTSKMEALGHLVYALNGAYAGEPAGFSASNDPGAFDHYDRLARRIRLANPSIVTTLHEFGHHLGKGERGACRWSVWLFKKTFPRQFEKLVFRGHMLVRP